MVLQSDKNQNITGRRQFLRSLFGLRGSGNELPAAPTRLTAGRFIWADLKTGQVGFPTGKDTSQTLPGTLMQLVAAAAISEDGLPPAHEVFECLGGQDVVGSEYACPIAHGKLGLVEAMGHSCNRFFAQAALAISPDRFLDYARMFCLDQGVAGLSAGKFPERPSAGATELVFGIAQDLTPHALQILRLVALIATGGRCPALHSAEDPSSAGLAPKCTLSDSTWDILQQGMGLACQIGAASQVDPDSRLRLAAKTGSVPAGQTGFPWVAGYFPRSSPRHAFCARGPSGAGLDEALRLASKHLLSGDWPEDQ